MGELGRDHNGLIVAVGRAVGRNRERREIAGHRQHLTLGDVVGFALLRNLLQGIGGGRDPIDPRGSVEAARAAVNLDPEDAGYAESLG
ncbi:MAG: hypothetical protein ACRD1Z_04745, partial [Vicinamibacteria bacterium]